MKTTVLALTLAVLLSLTTALALPHTTNHRSSSSSSTLFSGITVTLVGATNDPNDQYTLFAPFGKFVSAAPFDPHHLSISYVYYDHEIASCVFEGVDEASAPPVEADGHLGPPQGIVGMYCGGKE